MKKITILFALFLTFIVSTNVFAEINIWDYEEFVIKENPNITKLSEIIDAENYNMVN